MNFLYKNIALWGMLSALFGSMLSCTQPVHQPLEPDSLGYNLMGVDTLVSSDAEMDKMILPYKDSVNKLMGKVIGESDIVMVKGYPEGTLGNFVCDLILESCNTLGYPADFSMNNNGGLRNILPKGEITLNNVFQLMPFDNRVVVVEMDAEHIRQFLQYIPQGDDLAVSGVKLKIVNDSAMIISINGLPYDSNKSYLMATNDYLAKGGGNMSFLMDAPLADTEILLRDMIATYIINKHQKIEKINAVTDGRIEIVR